MFRGDVPGMLYKHPGMELHTGTTPQLVDSVLRGELHIAFAVQPAFDEDLWVKPLAKEGFSLGISKNHRLARKPEVMAREIDGERLFWIPRQANPDFYDHTVEYIESTGAKPSLREVLSFAHALEIVSQDFGIALLPRSATRLTHSGVLYKPITDKPLWIESAVCGRRDVHDDRIQTFLDGLLVELTNQRLTQ
jgi:DNA-binding transcriptional LysR family regulator